jgi:transporter family protein
VPWIIPTLYYVVAVGALGIFGKVALRTLQWPDMLLWTGVGYIAVAGILLALGKTRVAFVPGTFWAILAGATAISSLIALYLALGRGQVGTVSAVTAGYPVVTLVLAAVFLAEKLTLARGLGAALVVVGVAMLSLA